MILAGDQQERTELQDNAAERVLVRGIDVNDLCAGQEVAEQWISGMERVMGIEPTLAAWEAAVLPLNYTRAWGDSTRLSRGPPIAGARAVLSVRPGSRYS
jgi:hypothetical protein